MFITCEHKCLLCAGMQIYQHRLYNMCEVNIDMGLVYEPEENNTHKHTVDPRELQTLVYLPICTTHSVNAFCSHKSFTQSIYGIIGV